MKIVHELKDRPILFVLSTGYPGRATRVFSATYPSTFSRHVPRPEAKIGDDAVLH